MTTSTTTTYGSSLAVSLATTSALSLAIISCYAIGAANTRTIRGNKQGKRGSKGERGENSKATIDSTDFLSSSSSSSSSSAEHPPGVGACRSPPRRQQHNNEGCKDLSTTPTSPVSVMKTRVFDPSVNEGEDNDPTETSTLSSSLRTIPEIEGLPIRYSKEDSRRITRRRQKEDDFEALRRHPLDDSDAVIMITSEDWTMMEQLRLQSYDDEELFDCGDEMVPHQ